MDNIKTNKVSISLMHSETPERGAGSFDNVKIHFMEFIRMTYQRYKSQECVRNIVIRTDQVT